MPYAYLDVARNVITTREMPVAMETVQTEFPAVVVRIDDAPDGLWCLENCTAENVQHHRMKEGMPGQAQDDYEVVEYLDLLKAKRIAEVTLKNEELFNKGALFDGKRFAITKDDHAGWLAIVMVKDSLIYPYQVYTINPPEPYLLPDANAVVGLVFGVLFPRCTEIYATGQVIDNELMAATSKAEIDAIIDTRE
jgi:hypothetical protein